MHMEENWERKLPDFLHIFFVFIKEKHRVFMWTFFYAWKIHFIYIVKVYVWLVENTKKKILKKYFLFFMFGFMMKNVK